MKSIGYIDEHGKYHRGESKKMGWDVNPNHKSWSHDMQRREFAAEIIQPHKNGKPNPKFIKAHPETAKEYWSQEVIDKALREGAAE